MLPKAMQIHIKNQQIKIYILDLIKKNLKSFINKYNITRVYFYNSEKWLLNFSSNLTILE